MFAKDLSLNDAFTFVRARKPDISPNFHFMEQLYTFERQLKNDPNRRAFSIPSSSSSSSATFDGHSHTPLSANSSISTHQLRSNRDQQEFLLGPGSNIGVSPDSGRGGLYLHIILSKDIDKDP